MSEDQSSSGIFGRPDEVIEAGIFVLKTQGWWIWRRQRFFDWLAAKAWAEREQHMVKLAGRFLRYEAVFASSETSLEDRLREFEAKRVAGDASYAGLRNIRVDPSLLARQAAESSRAQYLQGWRESAKLHAEGGDYEWMCSFLSSHRRVLEIGVGQGSSTLSLVRSGHDVLCVDENPACLDACEATLQLAGIVARKELRGTIRAAGRGQYQVDYQPPSVETGWSGVRLVEGDAIRDPKLIEGLTQLERFDAVACWLIGTHGTRRYGMDVAVSPEVQGEPGMYRLQSQNAVYSLADAVLRPGGVLHIVDRGFGIPDAPALESMEENHRDQAEGSSLKIGTMQYRAIAALTSSAGIPMRGTIPSEVSGQPVLLSIIAEKQGPTR